MAQFQLLIKKKDCEGCSALKHWLKQEEIEFEEWNVENPEIEEKLLADERYTRKFCDIESCMPHIPAVRVAMTGDYYFTGLDGIFNVYELQQIIKKFDAISIKSMEKGK